MNSKHGLPDQHSAPAVQRGQSHKRRPVRRQKVVAAVAGVAIGIAAAAVYSVVSRHDGDSPAPPPGPQAATVTQTGRITAISETSITAQSSNGFTRSYTITPQTTSIGLHQGASPRDRYSVNDVVTIVATLSGGAATATAVTSERFADLNGPPMDAPGSPGISPTPAAGSSS
jgi:hypothetical protein